MIVLKANLENLDGAGLTPEEMQIRCRNVACQECILDELSIPIVMAGLTGISVQGLGSKIFITQRNPENTIEFYRAPNTGSNSVWVDRESGAYVSDRGGTLFITSYEVMEGLDGHNPVHVEDEGK